MTRDKVLSLLNTAGDFISGEEMSRQIGVSRMTVSSAVKSLRGEGYDITSVTNRGYKLNGGPDNITAGELAPYLAAERLKSIICLDTVDSTNNYLKANSDGAANGTVVIADEQTGGKGRLGRSFSSPAGKGLYLSMLMRPDCSPADTANITAWVAVAARRAVERASGIETDIKWVNDLLLEGRKICGILTEMAVESESGHVDYVVVGIGINVNHDPSDFPEEIRDKAGSLKMYSGSTHKRAVLAAELIKELDKIRDGFPALKEEYLEAYRKYCSSIGAEVIARGKGQERRGRVIAVNDDFSIKIKFAEGKTEDLNTGEISILPVKEM